MMCTPSGRFQPNRRLCLSMSDFHPESWNPMWSITTILTGLYSFMIETNPTLGSIETSLRKKRHYAASSLEYNVRNDKMFCKLFPEYVERYEKERTERLAGGAPSNGGGDAVSATSQQMALRNALLDGLDVPLGPALAGLFAILSIVVVLCRFL